MIQALNEIKIEGNDIVQIPGIQEDQIVPMRYLIHESNKILKQMLNCPLACLDTDSFYFSNEPVLLERDTAQKPRMLDFCLVSDQKSNFEQEWMLALKSHND